MSAESLFHDLLGLGTDWRVKELTHLPGAHSEVRIVIEATDGLYESYRCPDDGGSVRPYDHAPLRKWRHLNIFQHECYLECRLPRVKCGQCGKVKTVKGPWEGKIKGFTLLFEAFALTLLREMPVNAVARIVGEYDTRLWRLLEAYVNEAYQEADYSSVRVVGCDELKQANLITAKAYQMRLNLQEIYNLSSLDCFKRKLIEWCDWVQSYGKSKGYLFKPMVAAAKSILTHFDGIVSFASSRITNAFMEGLNSVFSAVKRKARGYRSNKNLIIMLYFVAGKLAIKGLE